MKFTQIIITRVYSVTNNDDNSRLVYIMQYRNQNKNLRSKKTNHRENGEISIGSYISLTCIFPTDQ